MLRRTSACRLFRAMPTKDQREEPIIAGDMTPTPRIVGGVFLFLITSFVVGTRFSGAEGVEELVLGAFQWWNPPTKD